MAALAFGLVGSAIGSAFGMPSLGFSVGSALGGLLFPTKQPNSFGPQMGDMSVTSSAYGADIPYGFGTMRIAGNIIWASPIQEVANTSSPSKKGKGGGGKGGGKTTVYTYYGNWAVGFAHGPAESVTRIWFDGVLVFDSVDVGGVAPSGVPVAAGTGRSGVNGTRFAVLPGSTTYTGLNFRFYKGDEVQVADPLIEAWMAIGDVSPPDTQATFKSGTTPTTPAGEPSKVAPGSQAVPGHRGLCYIVFENWCLTNNGNHIPMVTAEITFNNAPNYPWIPLLPNTNPATNQGLTTATEVGPGVAVDLIRGTSFRVTSVDGLSYIRRFDPTTMIEDLVKSLDEIVTTPITGLGGHGISNIVMGIDGFLYIVVPEAGATSGSNVEWVMKVDPNSLKELGRADIGGFFGLVHSTGILRWGMAVDQEHSYSLVVGIYDGEAIVIGCTPSGGFLPVGKTGSGAGFSFSAPGSGATGELFFGCLPDPTSSATGIAMWAPGHIFAAAEPVWIYSVDTSGTTPAFTLLGEFTVADLVAVADVAPADSGGGMQTAHGMWGDVSTGSILFAVYTLTTSGSLGDILLVSFDIATKTLNWSLNCTAAGIGVPNDTGGSGLQTTILGHTLWWATGTPNQVVEIDTLAGTVLDIQTWPADVPSIDGGAFGQQIYDGNLGAIIGTKGETKIYVNRHHPGGTTVGSIVRAMSERVGLFSATDLDTTEIDVVPIKGYFIGQPTSARDAILPLCQAYLFDAVESDGVIKWPLRGKSSVRTLTQEADLAPVDTKTNLVVLETRAQEVDMPIYLAVSYYDGNNNYQQGTRIRRRSAVPIQNDPSGSQNAPTVHTQNIASLQWPIVLDAQTAATAADKYLWTTWLERTTFKQKLHWGHMDLDPSDVVEVQLTDGTTYTQRLTKLVLGGDLSIEADACSENSAVYKSGAQGGDDFIMVIPNSGPAFSKLLLLPTPLLDDGASLGQENSVLFYGASNYSAAGFSGCSVEKSADQINWTVADVDAYKAKWGTTGTVLPDRPDPFSWDDDSTLAVFLKNNASIENATDAELLDGANAMAVFNADGNPEVIQFGKVLSNVDGSFTISHLLRGRRGTDSWAVNHGAGLEVVLLDKSTTRDFGLTLSELTTTLHYRAVGLGLTVDLADDVALSSSGNDLKPYAPVHDAATRPSTVWDLTYSGSNYTFSTVNVPDDRAVHVGPIFTGGGMARTALPLPPGRWYVEFNYFFGINSDGWGFMDAAQSQGSYFGAPHSVLVVDALHATTGRLGIAVNTIDNKAWYNEDGGPWKGAGGAPGDPTGGGTNGIDLSAMTAPYYVGIYSQSGSSTIYSSPAFQAGLPPAGYTAGLPGSDLVLSWVRRTRIGGGLVDATGLVPLNEGSEAYDVEIMTGPGTGVVMRAYTDVPAPTVTYPSADILADWGTIPSTLTLRVYQLSSIPVIDRGFYVEQTVQVTGVT